LSELIEFFCNQRKTGRLKVDYALAPGVFFIKEGELVDAKLGALNGVEAIYFALTLPSAAFDFSAQVQSQRRTINEPWTRVVLACVVAGIPLVRHFARNDAPASAPVPAAAQPNATDNNASAPNPAASPDTSAAPAPEAVAADDAAQTAKLAREREQRQQREREQQRKLDEAKKAEQQQPLPSPSPAVGPKTVR